MHVRMHLGRHVRMRVRVLCAFYVGGVCVGGSAHAVQETCAYMQSRRHVHICSPGDMCIYAVQGTAGSVERGANRTSPFDEYSSSYRPGVTLLNLLTY